MQSVEDEFGRDGRKLYLDGSAASRLMRQLAAGVSACVTVTHVDGLVLARSAFHHSMNYRSVVAFGTARPIDDADRKTAALRVISEHLIAGRWAEVRGPNEKELRATVVLEFLIEEASAKTRSGPPIDDVEDYSWPVWAGVVPLDVAWRNPVTETPNMAEPTYVRRPPFTLA